MLAITKGPCLYLTYEWDNVAAVNVASVQCSEVVML